MADRTLNYDTIAKPNMGEGWGDLYKTYDRWKQEDQMWYDTATGASDEIYPRKISEAKARMAAGGMKVGTRQWNSTVNQLVNERASIDTNYQNKIDTRENSALKVALQGKYDELKNTQEMEGGDFSYQTPKLVRPAGTYWRDYVAGHPEDGGRYVDLPDYFSKTETVTVTEYREQETGNLLYGTGGNRQSTPSFDELWSSEVGGATDVSNPYQPDAIIPESSDVTRAKSGASGRAY